MINAIAIRTAGEDTMANEMARKLADPALRRRVAELEQEVAALKGENRWLKEKVRRKQMTINEVYGERLCEYRKEIARDINRRNRWLRFIHCFVEKDPVEEGYAR